MRERLDKTLDDKNKKRAKKAGAIIGVLAAAGNVVGCSAESKCTNPEVPVATATAEGKAKVTTEMAQRAADIALDNVAVFAKKSEKGLDGKRQGHLYEGDLLIKSDYTNDTPGLTDGSKVHDMSSVIVDSPKASVAGGYETAVSAIDMYYCIDKNGNMVKDEDAEKAKAKEKAVCGTMPEEDITQVMLKSTDKPDISSVDALVESLKGKATVVEVDFKPVSELDSKTLQHAVDEIAES